jgi:biopolymer transport protein ExbB/TolQ
MNEWILAHGGLVGLGVLLAKYTLILFSIVSVAVMFERIWTLRNVRHVEASDFETIRAAMLHNDEEKSHRQIEFRAFCGRFSDRAGTSRCGRGPLARSDESGSQCANRQVAK